MYKATLLYPFFLIFFLLILFSTTALAENSKVGKQKTKKNYWSILGGYGISHKGLGNTKVQVQVLDLIPRYERILINDIGSSWYRSRHSLMMELPVSLVVDPDTAPIIGVNILGAWTFTYSKEILPYFFGGGGILYTNADIPGLGSEVNGNWQFGTGLRFQISPDHWINIEYRFHHISNTGAKDPNDPINSSKFLVGITF